MTYREVSDLSLDKLMDHEMLALAALAREIIAADGRLSEDEQAAMDGLAQRVGPERFDEMLERAAALDTREETLGELVDAVDRRPAAEAIYVALFELAAEGSINPSELELLDWLAESWELEVQEPEIPDQDDEDDLDDESFEDDDDDESFEDDEEEDE